MPNLEWDFLDGAFRIVGLEFGVLALPVLTDKQDGKFLGVDAIVFAEELVDIGLPCPVKLVIAHGLVDAGDLVVPQGFGLAVKQVDLSSQLDAVHIDIKTLLADVAFGIPLRYLLQNVVVGCPQHRPYFLGTVHGDLVAVAFPEFGDLWRLCQTCSGDV